jgi:hypothetical protein
VFSGRCKRVRAGRAPDESDAKETESEALRPTARKREDLLPGGSRRAGVISLIRFARTGTRNHLQMAFCLEVRGVSLGPGSRSKLAGVGGAKSDGDAPTRAAA